MSTADERAATWHKGLVFRIAAFLSLALAPIGIVGFIQTLETQAQSERAAELTLLTLTSEAASREKRVIERGLGAAEALGSIAYGLRDDAEQCSSYLREFANVNPTYAFAGFIPPSGMMTCSTAGGEIDFSLFTNFENLIGNPRPNVEVNRDAPGSGRSVIVISQPIKKEGEFIGYLSVSVPQAVIAPEDDLLGVDGPLGLITFNVLGDILTTERGFEIAEADLPADLRLQSLAGMEPNTFTSLDLSGEERIYAVVPVVPDVAYALGTWRTDRPIAASLTGFQWSGVYPILMWIATISVAVFALHRLVIRPIRTLERDMVGFAKRRNLPPVRQAAGEPQEISSIQEQFRAMAATVSREEAELENLIYEKDELISQKSVLLKEVHHRVKNNLQLISSIMNMEVRSAEQPETQRILRRLQERVLGLAGIHRKLYLTDSVDKIDAATLLSDLAAQTEAMVQIPRAPISIVVKADKLMLVPDQAVPFSLLVSELLTNSVKYSGTSDGTRSEIGVFLSNDGEGAATLRVENPISGMPSEGTSTGLGTRLIRAFVTQMDGELTVETDPARYQTVVSFRAQESMPDTLDY